MTASSTASVWIYPWTVSTTTSGIVSATVAGTDLSGNAFAGTTSVTFTIDNTSPTLISFVELIDDRRKCFPLEWTLEQVLEVLVLGNNSPQLLRDSDITNNF